MTRYLPKDSPIARKLSAIDDVKTPDWANTIGEWSGGQDIRARIVFKASDERTVLQTIYVRYIREAYWLVDFIQKHVTLKNCSKILRGRLSFLAKIDKYDDYCTAKIEALGFIRSDNPKWKMVALHMENLHINGLAEPRRYDD